MNGYTSQVRKMTDNELKTAVKKCSTYWWNYTDPSSDSHWWYRALREEHKRRFGVKRSNNDNDGPGLRMC